MKKASILIDLELLAKSGDKQGATLKAELDGNRQDCVVLLAALIQQRPALIPLFLDALVEVQRITPIEYVSRDQMFKDLGI